MGVARLDPAKRNTESCDLHCSNQEADFVAYFHHPCCHMRSYMTVINDPTCPS
jgi:hypothetical protein